MQNKISIIMPVYNAEKYLAKALDSLCAQTYPNIEILCVNDGSTDESLRILRIYQSIDSRIKVFDQKNSGPAKARNVGLENAVGEFIMFCDADDTYTPTMCEEMYQAIRKKNVDVVMCNTRLFKEDLTETNNPWYFPFKVGKYELNQDLIPRINVFLWNKIFRTSLIRVFKIDFPEGHKSDDNLFIYKYIMSAKNIYFLDEKLYNHFERENSIMNLYRSNGIKLKDIFDKSDIMVLLWDYLKNSGLLEKNQNAFLSRLYMELVYSWKDVPKVWEQDFLQNLLKNMERIGFENLRYSDVRKQSFFNALGTQNFYAAKKILDTLLFDMKAKRRKYIFQQNPKPVFKQYPIGFVFNIDNGFVPYFSVALQSIIEFSSAKNDYDIIILNTDITDENKEKIKRMLSQRNNFSVRFFDMAEYERIYQISEYQTIQHIRTAAYYRLFIPKIFENYEKIVYLDSDIVVNRDIGELAKVNLKNYSCAAIVDFDVSLVSKDCEMGFDGLCEYGKNVLNFTNWKSYFNSGVMIFDIPKMIQKGYLEQFVKVAKINNRFFNDQNVLNSVLQGDVSLLDDGWNMQINAGGYVSLTHLLPIDQIKILHFCCRTKPWNNLNILFANVWWEYAKKSPFYHILLENLFKQKFSAGSVPTVTKAVDYEELLSFIEYRKNRFKYFIYSMLSKLPILRNIPKIKNRKLYYKGKVKTVRGIVKFKMKKNRV